MIQHYLKHRDYYNNYPLDESLILSATEKLPLISYARFGDIDNVRVSVKHTDVDSTTESEGGETALFASSGQGHLDIVHTLLLYGANPNLCRADGGTPLIIASQNGHLKIVKLLCENGAEVNAQAHNGVGALFSAAVSGHSEIVKHLIEKEAEIDRLNSDGISAERACDILGISEMSKLLRRERFKKEAKVYGREAIREQFKQAAMRAISSKNSI